ncbi:MAG: EamA-like transporter family protein [candidate division WS6 bacterium OLB20]|uniref:EamA-like transporter family protein n=1 Tax=candidate division WS6 bacterium OLB20 TaxID=1617426 RepID=A0A136LZC2_9BACT|nr:MAG: EamA-like transporter family protein [candidate division WS6 bacterium OLB20]
MWILFSLVSTAALAGRSLVSKAGVDRQDPYVVAWATVFFSFPVAIAGVAVMGITVTDQTFWPLMLFRVFLDTVALLTLLTAFRLKSVSYITPLLSLTPIFTAIISYYMRGDRISAAGIAGLAFTAVSCIAIYFSERKLTLPENRHDLRKATALVALVALIFSFLDPIHTVIIERADEYTYFFISTICFSIVFTTIALIKSRKQMLESIRNRRLLRLNIATGMFLGVEVLSFFVALSAAPAVALVSSIRSANIALTTAGGYVLFRDRFNRLKLAGIAGVVIGVIVISLS